LEKILEEDNPFYFCEHENLLTRISKATPLKPYRLFENGEIHLVGNSSH
jgi:hypothetical protein